MEPLALNEVENELEIAGRYLMNPNSRLRDIAFIKRDLVRVLSELDAILTDGLPDARESKREYSRQINRILERIQALGH
jgi:aminoglycoside phosphotransferase (APT) family kinase protein